MARLAAPAGGRGDRFAAALAADEREVWVGAPGAGGPGRVFVFPGSATGFQIDGLQLLGPSWTDPAAAGVVDLDARQRRRRRRHRREPLRRRPLHLRARRVRRLARAADDHDAARRTAGVHRRRAPLQHDDRQGRDVRVRRRGPAVVPAAVATHRTTATTSRSAASGAGPIRRPSRNGRSSAAATARRSWTSRIRRSRASVADLPLTDGARPSAWREIKVYKDHAFIVSDGAGPHGIQIFDLTRLRTMKPQPNGLPQKVAGRLRSTATSTACTTWSSTRRAASAIRWDRAPAARPAAAAST